MSFVLDNSVALAWCFEDERSPAMDAILDRLVREGATVPQLWSLEALNGLLTAERRGRLDRDLRQRLMEFFADLPITVDGETGQRAWTATARLAEAHGLTAYDAAYLELAQRLAQPLATQDTALAAAARAVGVEVMP